MKEEASKKRHHVLDFLEYPSVICILETREMQMTSPKSLGLEDE